MPEPVNVRLHLGAVVLWGALADLAVLVASFVFFGGSHGPSGPMFVLGVLNAPVNELFNHLLPADQISTTTDAVLMFVVVLINGALYGIAVSLAVALWRRARGPKPAP